MNQRVVERVKVERGEDVAGGAFVLKVAKMM